MGGGDFQTQPPFPLRRRGDDQQQRPVAQQSVQPDQAPALPRPRQRSAALLATETHGPRGWHHGGIPGARDSGARRRRSPMAVVPHRVHGALSPQHPVQPPDGGPVGVERVLHLLAVLSIRPLRRDHCHRPSVAVAAGDRDRGGCRGDHGKPVARKDFVSARHALLRRQLGHQHLVLPR
ncbi:Uncharacterised protein [Mycobacterium tuberculosis]|nr:Uncharacterised protein [Mycobacterium tuberculosis]CKS76108.1 Uncharacterised protein [Mycobacterium tuberculosis]COW22432.1 Uncharacterised protein [Mycobacterium tuberculosis]